MYMCKADNEKQKGVCLKGGETCLQKAEDKLNRMRSVAIQPDACLSFQVLFDKEHQV